MPNDRSSPDSGEPSFRSLIQFDRFQRLYDYWQKIRGTRAMPARADIDPLDLKGVLGWVLLIDVEWSPLRFRFRLVGSEITTVRGVDLTGQYLDEVVSSNRDIVLRFNARVATEPCTGFHQVLDTLRDAKIGWVSRLSLPLSTDHRRVDMILGGFEYTRDGRGCEQREHFEPV